LETAVFNNREARIRFVKPKKNEDSSATSEDKILHPDTVKLIAERGKEVVKFAALTVVGVYATIKAIDTASQVIVKKTKSGDNE
jgi:hypothetical protein